MAPSPRHENSNARIQNILPTIGAQVWVNNHESGRNGWQLPPITCSDGKVRPFIIDTFARMCGGQMVAFEVDYNHATTLIKKQTLAQLGYLVLTPTPRDVDLWVEDPKLLREEVNHWMVKRFQNKPMEVVAH